LLGTVFLFVGVGCFRSADVSMHFDVRTSYIHIYIFRTYIMPLYVSVLTVKA
jgi:hypothetical protein